MEDLALGVKLVVVLVLEPAPAPALARALALVQVLGSADLQEEHTCFIRELAAFVFFLFSELKFETRNYFSRLV